MALLTRVSALLAVFLYSLLVAGQAGPNTLAPANHDARTMSGNGTWFIVAIPTTKVQAAVQKFKLAPVPRNDKSFFPHGFPKDAHPVLISASYDNDIRRGNLEIDALKGASIIVPFVDRLGDGTPFTYSAANLLGGANGEDLMGVVPVVVGSLQGNPLFLADVYPKDAAYQVVGPDQFSAQAKQVIIPNPVTGPGVVPSAIDLLFTTAKKPLYTARAFQSFSSQPLILRQIGKCQRNLVFFNETFANPIMRTGQITVYPVSGVIPKSLVGTYKNQGGYSANGEFIGFAQEDCATAAKKSKSMSML